MRAFFPNFFGSMDMFALVESAHTFQPLTESDKEGQAYRTGIYLTDVQETSDGTKFKLLRCSTNFRSGPTDNLRDVDRTILKAVNIARLRAFPQSAELNHVLAQIYHNQAEELQDGRIKERKARIGQHSDKTKDMPENGLLAFCTFYKEYGSPEFGKGLDADYCHKGITALTTLRFRSKENPDDAPIDIVLLPNSLFIITLQMNRLYTHEIVPSKLPLHMIPTRMGYVIRCSNTYAVHKHATTFIEGNPGGLLIPLTNPTDDEVAQLKALYKLENVSTERMEYGNFYFSLNEGDYLKPIV